MTDEGIKSIDNLVRDMFSGRSNSTDIFDEYESFKSDVMNNMNQMSDADFRAYADNIKVSLRKKISEMTVAALPAPLHRSDSLKFHVSIKKNFYFDFIKGSCNDWSKVDTYLSSYRNHQVADLVKDGSIANLTEFDKLKQSKICKEIMPSNELSKDFSDKVFQCAIRNLNKDNKSHVRLFDFTSIDHSPMSIVFITLFVAAFEKTASSIQNSTTMLVDLYNLSHHLSLKTEYFMMFSNLSKYFQQLLIDVVTRRFETDAGCQSYIIGALVHTLHDPKIYKAVKVLCCVLLKLILEFSDPNALSKIFSLQPDENPIEYRQVLKDFLENIMLRDMITNDNFLVYLPKIVKLMNALCFSLGSNSTCYILLPDGTAGCLHSAVFNPQAQETSYIMICPSAFKSVFGYGDDKTNIDILKQIDAVVGLEDFMSLSDKEGEDYTPESISKV